MKKAIKLILLYSIVFLAGCYNKQTENNTESAAIDPDTAVAASAPVEVVSDSTLQPQAEIRLKAIGNTLEEMSYDQDTLEVTSGARIKLFFTNEGVEQSMIHNVVFTKPKMHKLVALAGAKVGSPGNYIPESDAVIAASSLALPGQTLEMEFNAPAEPGVYNYVCTYPGHWKEMHGVLHVKKPLAIGQ